VSLLTLVFVQKNHQGFETCEERKLKKQKKNMIKSWKDFTKKLEFQWLLSHVCGVAAIVHPLMYLYLSIKYEETRNSCLLSVKSRTGSRHLVFWSLGTLTGLRDQVWRLIA
jgi:hypothetical protein